ncbi:acyl-CoA synthetase [Pseudorhodoferax soli]|uniref:Long-chain acyl-CoA synthetase n=1 Tax=Pseudorhodoferax soli TaxID=545864 RepID=A0A368XNB3_9BURK|nr:long-chain fatty acid--CoA ligase [Pseudorhodoferax soli]RCW69470.1 long-chain acyl-CoA synthetase [Pseudorhodoferax soli]
MQLTQGLHRMLQQQPGKVATWFALPDGSVRTRTYAQLGERAMRIASVLRAHGVAPGDRVALLSANSDRYLEFFMATWWAGAIACPVNMRWSAAEMAYSLDDAGVRVLLVGADFVPMLPAIHEQAREGFAALFFGDPDNGSQPPDLPDLEALLAASAPGQEHAGRQDDPAAIFYTGGTTGLPKGVVLSHLNLWSSAMGRMAQVPSSADAVALHVAPMFHLASAGRLISHTLIGGSAMVLASFRADSVVDAIERHAVAEVVLIPSMLQMLLDHPCFDPARLASLRRITYGGAPISPALLDRALAALPQAEFVQCYGQTEASPLITINSHESHVGEGRRLGRLRSAGRVVYGVQMRVVDPDGRDTAPGVAGEIIARGPNVMLGYWRKPEETARALRNGWLHTGDGGYLDEHGYLYVVDRLKDMIITGGENVYSAEVENALAEHPAIAQCAVIGIPSAAWGESVHAVVVLKAGASATAAELQAHCKARIAGYKCPKSVEFRGELPMSSVGKVLKTALRRPYLDAMR